MTAQINAAAVEDHNRRIAMSMTEIEKQGKKKTRSLGNH